MSLNKTKKYVIDGTTNKEVKSTTRGAESVSKGANVEIHTNTTETSRTGLEYKNREGRVSVTDTSKTYTK